MLYIFRNTYIFGVGCRMSLSRDLRRTSAMCITCQENINFKRRSHVKFHLICKMFLPKYIQHPTTSCHFQKPHTTEWIFDNLPLHLAEVLLKSHDNDILQPTPNIYIYYKKYILYLNSGYYIKF